MSARQDSCWRAQRTFRAGGRGRGRVEDLQAADGGWHAQGGAARVVERARLQQPVQQADEADVPPVRACTEHPYFRCFSEFQRFRGLVSLVLLSAPALSNPPSRQRKQASHLRQTGLGLG